jgi:hypothetical protein
MNRKLGVTASRSARALKMLTVVALAWAAEASAADTYVILSLVGDHVTVVSQRRQTGSHMDVNDYQVTPLAPPGFDDFAVRTADATIAKTRPDAGSVTIRASDPELYKVRDSWLDADVTGVAELISSIKKQLPPLPDAHLLLITPYRDQPELRTGSDDRGAGKVAGLGFYLDSVTRFWAMEGAPGFLGVFVNFQLVLINLQTNAIEAHERVVLGTTHPAAYAEDRTPWNALTPAQKSKAIESLMKKGIEDKLPGMLSAPKR